LAEAKRRKAKGIRQSRRTAPYLLGKHVTNSKTINTRQSAIEAVVL